VFQFESGGMQRMLQEVRPDRFDDLVALNALYRPGPMDYIPTFKRGKHDPESVKYSDPRLKSILEPTYGVAAYQSSSWRSPKLRRFHPRRGRHSAEGDRQKEREAPRDAQG
jgi:DNA polymerase-3 subunit alpha